MKETFPNIYLYRRIVQAKLFIDGNYHQYINLDNVADEAFFSKFHFIRLFKNAYGQTPHQYLIKVRIDRAKTLLQNGLTPGDVCFAIGFTSITSFSDLFKRLTKTTPAAYQQQQLQRKNEIARAPLKFIPNCFAEQNGWTAKNSNFQEA